FECRERVEVARPVARRTVIHSRHHEKAIFVAHLLRASQDLNDALVVIDAVLWRNKSICPPVVLDQFSPVGKEGFQIRVNRIDPDSFVKFITQNNVLIKVHCLVIPLRILEDYVLPLIGSERRGLDRGGHVPTLLAAWSETWK